MKDEDVLSGFFLLVGAVILYFVPAIIGGQRRASHQGGIFAINLFFGWTVIGWIAALFWACTDEPAGIFQRDCPFCAEKIKPQAIVCPHCQRDLPLPVLDNIPPVPDIAVEGEPSSMGRKVSGFSAGAAIVIVPAAAAFLWWLVNVKAK